MNHWIKFVVYTVLQRWDGKVESSSRIRQTGAKILIVCCTQVIFPGNLIYLVCNIEEIKHGGISYNDTKKVLVLSFLILLIFSSSCCYVLAAILGDDMVCILSVPQSPTFWRIGIQGDIIER
jgi:hypothetical protein